MKKWLVFALIAVLVLGIAGCSGGEAGEADAPEAQDEAAENTGLELADEITLPDGWAMDAAISAEEVGAITGETMEYFPDAGSAAQSGSPIAQYMIAGEEGSGIRFAAKVEGGADVYDVLDQYAVEGTSEEIAGLADKAYMLELEDGDFAIVALKNDARYEIRFDPTFYEVDKGSMAADLMATLLSNVYKP